MKNLVIRQWDKGTLTHVIILPMLERINKEIEDIKTGAKKDASKDAGVEIKEYGNKLREQLVLMFEVVGVIAALMTAMAFDAFKDTNGAEDKTWLAPTYRCLVFLASAWGTFSVTFAAVFIIFFSLLGCSQIVQAVEQTKHFLTLPGALLVQGLVLFLASWFFYAEIVFKDSKPVIMFIRVTLGLGVLLLLTVAAVSMWKEKFIQDTVRGWSIADAKDTATVSKSSKLSNDSAAVDRSKAASSWATLSEHTVNESYDGFEGTEMEVP